MNNYLTGEARSLKDYGSVLSKAKAVSPYIIGKSFSEVGQVADDMKRGMLSKGLLPATINRRLALLKRITNIAFDIGTIGTPEAQRIKLIPGEEPRHFYLSLSDFNALVDLCPTTGFIMRIAAFTGLRRGEIFKLTKNNIRDGFIVLTANTKTGIPRIIPIPKRIKKCLVVPIDKALDYQLRLEFEAARKKLGMDHIRFNDLRHSYASWLVQENVSLKIVQSLLGHTTPTTTNRYAHLRDDSLDVAKSILDKKK